VKRRFRQLVVEAHRRSLWQVLGVYLGTSWVVIQVVNELTRAAGLPDWVPPFALVLLLLGLPIVIATAVVQEGAPGMSRAGEGAAGTETFGGGGTHDGEAPDLGPGTDEAVSAHIGVEEPPDAELRRKGGGTLSFLERHLTWKRSLLSGVVAFTFLGLLVAAYLVSWALGIGPVGSLVARGEISEGEVIVLADFGAPADDPSLGAVVTDALRIDLLEAAVLHVLEPSDLRGILYRMRLDPDAVLTGELAREVALREGLHAVLDGDVARAGSAFVLTANLRDAQTGRSLAAVRETAAGPDELVAAIDRLSRRIRERAGESLRSINQGPRLDRVTTASLDALRLYSEAGRVDALRAIPLLEEALELDPEFAMAWRRLAVVRFLLIEEPAGQAEAATRAYQLRDRLTERERHHAVAYYHVAVTGDREAMNDAYRRVLDIAPDDPIALIGLGYWEYKARRDHEAAVELFRRAVDGPERPAIAFIQLVESLIALGRMDEASEAAEAFVAAYAEDAGTTGTRAWVLLLQGRDEEAERAIRAFLDSQDPDPGGRAGLYDHLARVAIWRGGLREARALMDEAERSGREGGPSMEWWRRVYTAHLEATAGDPDRAAALLSRGIQGEDPSSPPLGWGWFQLLTLGLAERVDDARTLVQRLEEAEGETQAQYQPELEAAGALVSLLEGDPEGAVGELESVRSSLRCSICFATQMGWALSEAGRLDKATEEWERVMAWKDLYYPLSVHHANRLWVLQRLPTVYEELGDTERALHYHRRLVELWADADPELQPRVEHARERIRALESEESS
jgi:eukaryotic-like serine/threonine-protein kinase